MKPSWQGLSDFGAKRKTNEDYLLADAELGLFIVCDGVSGNLAGNVASEMCAKVVQKWIRENRAIISRYRSEPTIANRSQLVALVQKSLEAASAEVYAAGQADPKKRGMATTAEVLLVAHDHAILGHVGDSRIYLVRAKQVYQLSEDHSVAQEMRKQGLWDSEAAKNSPYANTLTRAIGHQDYIQVDTLEVELSADDLNCSAHDDKEIVAGCPFLHKK